MKKYKEKDYKIFYNTKYLEHEKLVEENPEIRRRLLSIKDFLNNHKGIKKILDVGCSKGYLSKVIKKKELYGVDISKELLRNVKGYKEVKEASILHIPYNDNFFDVVVCFQVLEHIPDYEKAIDELLRVSNRFLLLSTDFVTKSERIFSRDPFGNPHGHMHQFNLNNFLNLFERRKIILHKMEYHFPLLKYSTLINRENILYKVVRMVTRKLNSILEKILYKKYFNVVNNVLINNEGRKKLNLFENFFKLYGKIMDLEMEFCLELKKQK